MTSASSAGLGPHSPAGAPLLSPLVSTSRKGGHRAAQQAFGRGVSMHDAARGPGTDRVPLTFEAHLYQVCMVPANEM